MADFTYTCPKCSATLRPKNPIPAGKKIKCPKCENIFAPAGAGPASAPARPAPAKPKVEEDQGAYGLVKDEEPPPEPAASPAVEEDDDDQPKKKKKKKPSLEDDLLAQHAPRSKRGPVQALCQVPSNRLLATASFACVGCIITVMMTIWPVAFSGGKEDEKKAAPPAVGKADPAKAKSETPADKWTIELLAIPDGAAWRWNRLVFIGLTVIAFIYNGIIVLGAVNMQSVESYRLATLGSVLMLLPVNFILFIFAFAWFLKFLESILEPGNLIEWATILALSGWCVYAGLACMGTLRKQEVVEGFAEQQPDH